MVQTFNFSNMKNGQQNNNKTYKRGDNSHLSISGYSLRTDLCY